MLRFNSYFYFLLLFISLPFHIFAEDIVENDELIVTGSHTPISINEIGSSYTIITQEQIKKRQAIFVSDLLRNVPGFAVSTSGVRGSQTQVRVRGAEANNLLVLIDGIKANDIAGGDEFDFSNLVTTNIERIEIIRGPQSALYGSDAAAGVINIITKKGDGALTINAYSEAGSFGTFNAGGAISGSTERFHYNLSGSHLSTAGNNISRVGNEEDAYQNDTISFATGITLLDNLKLDISGRHTEANIETDTSTDNVLGFPIDTDSNSESSSDYIQARVKLGLFNNTWEQIVGSSFVSTENDNFSSGVESSSTQGKKMKLDYQTNLYFDTPNFANATHTLTFAVDYEKDIFTQNRNGTNADQKRNAKTFGYVAGYKIDLWERLFLSNSIRHDDNNEFKDETTYRTTAAYNFAETGTRLHASYGTGVKRPTFTQRFGFFAGFTGNPNVTPEKNKEWDLGVQQFFWNNRASMEVIYFKGRFENEISSSGATVINLKGTSKREGVEISTQFELFKNLNLSANYTWLDATEPNGAEEIRRPRNTASLNLDYGFLNDRANVNLNANFNGSQTDNIFPPSAGFAKTPVNLGSYTLVNLATSYRFTDKLNLYAKIENLLNKRYEDVAGFQTPGIGGYLGVNLTINP